MALLGALFLAGGREGQTRLQPYYIVKGVGAATLKPRILFVLDTSGSMRTRVQSRPQQCAFSECEVADAPGESRISASRRAIRAVVEATRDSASFALMTFGQRPPPGDAPGHCHDGRRFHWTQSISYEANDTDFPWQTVRKYEPSGMWVLCDDVNQPYPYLRWDQLGVGSMIATNRQSGPVPPSPLISTRAGEVDSPSNASRRVQWFPDFLGVRARLDEETDPDRTLLHATYGDYGNTDADRFNNVWGHDFYYWPYVDGFPGYSGDDISPTSGGFGGTDNADRAGVVEAEGDEATLYAPLYMNLEDSDIPQDRWGPASRAQATNQVLSHVSPLIEGGVDADGGTPWMDVVGRIPDSVRHDNAPRSHSTVASYLRFATEGDAKDVCAPMAAVLVSDGNPSREQGGAGLYERLARLRTALDVRTYVVGFLIEGDEIGEMACAAAGACDGYSCATPCDDEPANDWDTCAESGNPDRCAFMAGSSSELVAALTQIIDQQIGVNAPAGPGTSLNDFGVPSGGDPTSSEAIVQTKVSAHTEYPSWKGHVVRQLCDDPADPTQPDGPRAAWCRLPSPEFGPDEEQPRFGPCDLHRTWDAGECLQQMDYRERRLFTNDASNRLIRIAREDGTATMDFEAQLVDLGLIEGPDRGALADDIAGFIQGKDWPDGWKLPGLANSAPVVVRRVPEYDADLLPAVPIRDPHCGGRFLGEVDNANLPRELVDFARDAWSDRITSPQGDHLEYQEAVLIGDDLGVLHAFHLDSGNEMWGFLPRFLLHAAVRQAQVGAQTRGQPTRLEDHIYGMSSTLNHGWAYDEVADRWRHIGLFGLGAGGTEYMALDLGHMSPQSPSGPFQVLWTTEDTALKADYDQYVGESWARPALTYELPSYSLSNNPRSLAVFGSGYRTNDDSSSPQGRTLLLADAISGRIQERAELPVPTDPVYESTFGALVDPSVASHCRSRYWAEMEEVYVPDPAGRLFRWDLGTNGDRDRDHEADSRGPWNGTALEVARFPACQGDGATCSVNEGNRGDVFVFSPAVTANDRIDDFQSSVPGEADGVDQFLVALVSGSPADDSIDATAGDDDFHSSLYLLVDDHAGADQHGGFEIPPGAPLSAVGERSSYVRLAFSQLERTRCVRYPANPDAEDCSDVRRFSPATRPTRPPRIVVRSVIDQDTVPTDPDAPDVRPPTVLDEAEVVEITFTVYEPGEGMCDPRWYDDRRGEWVTDRGATYELSFQLFANDGGGFDFLRGYQGDTVDFDEDFDTGLVMTAPRQITTPICRDGNCGPTGEPPGLPPCDNGGGSGEPGRVLSVPLSRTEIMSFTPIE